MRKKNLLPKIYFVLIPALDKADHFGGMLTLDNEKLSIDMAAECGGVYIPLSYSLN